MAGPLYVISLLLVLSGALKVVSPDAAASALSTLGVRVPDIGVRGIGGAEMALGVAGLIIAGPYVALALAVAYLCFAGVAELLRRGAAGTAGASCGCFGSNNTPPSILHTGVNVLAAAVGFAAVAWPPDDVWSVLADQVAAGVPFVGFVLVGVYLMFVAFTALPEALAPPAALTANANVSTFSMASPLPATGVDGTLEQ